MTKEISLDQRLRTRNVTKQVLSWGDLLRILAHALAALNFIQDVHCPQVLSIFVLQQVISLFKEQLKDGM